MLKKILFLSLAILAACSNPPAPVEPTTKKEKAARPKAPEAKPAASPWKTGSYAPKEGETEGRKYVRLVTEGTFSDSTGTGYPLFAEVIVNKSNAGILLHELKKSNPARKFSEAVNIKLINAEGEELQMTSNRSWNSSGGIMLERNNNDYSRFRIFLLQNSGTLIVEISDSETRIYNFHIDLEGFSDLFTSI